MADEVLGELHDAVGNAAVEHQFAGEYEKRNGEKREHAHAGGHALEHHGDGQAFVQNGRHCGKADGKGHRHAEDQQGEKHHAQDGQCHEGTTSVPLTSAIMCSIEKRQIRAPATRMGMWLRPSGTLSVGTL